MLHHDANARKVSKNSKNEIFKIEWDEWRRATIPFVSYGIRVISVQEPITRSCPFCQKRWTSKRRFQSSLCEVRNHPDAFQSKRLQSDGDNRTLIWRKDLLLRDIVARKDLKRLVHNKMELNVIWHESHSIKNTPEECIWSFLGPAKLHPKIDHDFSKKSGKRNGRLWYERSIRENEQIDLRIHYPSRGIEKLWVLTRPQIAGGIFPLFSPFSKLGRHHFFSKV